MFAAMSGITLAQAEERLQQYLDAEASVLAGQEYQIAGRTMKRANLKEISDGIDIWNTRVKRLSIELSGRGRSVTVASNH